MISIASSGVYNISTGATTAPIPKPSGLAVGDLMVAVISTVRGSITTAPTGWTVVGSNNLSYNACTVYKKIADASDVSASTFSWVGTYAIGGIIYRIPEGDFNNIQMSLTAPLTPKTKDNAVILVGTSSDDDSDSCTFSGYSTTGGAAVTYTEGYDSNGTSSSYYAAMGVASGIYSSFDNITAFNVTEDSYPDATSRFMLLIGDVYTVNHSDVFKNCVAYYKFEGNSNDSSIHHLDGIDTDITYSDVGGKEGKYASFNGSSSKILTSNNISLDPNGFTISLWFKTSQNTPSNYINMLNLTQGSCILQIFLNNSATGVNFQDSNGVSIINSGIAGLNDGKWHHLVAINKGSGVQAELYIDGIRRGNGTTNSYSGNFNNLVFNLGFWNYAYNGLIDEVGIWNRALSISEVQQLYYLAKPLHNGLLGYWKMDGNSYDFVGKNDGQDTSVSYNSSYGKIGQGVRFDADGDYIKGGNKIQLGTSDFTISLWVKSTQIQSDRFPMIFSIEKPTFPRYAVNIIAFSSTDNPNILCEMYSNGVGPVIFGTNIRDGNWHHIVLKKTSTQLTLYIDGKIKGTVSHSIGSVSDGTNVLYFGTYSLAVGAQTYIGDLDEVAIWNRALTGEEIQQLFYAGNANQYPLQTNMADMM